MPLLRPALLVLFMALSLPFVTCVATAADAKNRTVHAPGGVAIAGYDPVAYFTEGRAAKGSADHALRWRGATWLFTSQANLAQFEANPMAYFPQFGGYCVVGLAQGQAVPGNPEIWVIHEGRLYLSMSEDARSLWRADSRLLSQAAANWPLIGK